MLNGKTILKCIGTNRYEISLIQNDNDEFCVRTVEYDKNGEIPEFSSYFKDYNMANWIYDLKLSVLEGE